MITNLLRSKLTSLERPLGTFQDDGPRDEYPLCSSRSLLTSEKAHPTPLSKLSRQGRLRALRNGLAGEVLLIQLCCANVLINLRLLGRI